MNTSWPEPRRCAQPTYTRAQVEGNGPFPLHALIQCDGYFDTNADWLSARNSRLTRVLALALPAERLDDLRKGLQVDGWRVLP